MNDAFDIRNMESHIEVHKFRGGAIVGATLLALMFQAFVPVYFAKAAMIDLPLLITIYFGLSRRNPSTGLLLGMVIGLLQDSLRGPPVPLGSSGTPKQLSVTWRLRLEHAWIRNIPLRVSLSPSSFSVCTRA